MAVVVFQRKGDALVAQQKYDGKFVDGRESPSCFFMSHQCLTLRNSFYAGKPIKIEIISEAGDPLVAAPAAPRQPQSLFERLGVSATPVSRAPV